MKITRSQIAMDSYQLDISRLSDEISDTIDLVKESDDAEYWAAKVQHIISDMTRCCNALYDVMDEVLGQRKLTDCIETPVELPEKPSDDTHAHISKEDDDHLFYVNNPVLFMELAKKLIKENRRVESEIRCIVASDIL